MPRYIRNTVILAKPEATPGTDIVPAPATDAVLVSDVTITPLEAQNVDRKLIRGYLGASEQLVSTAFVRVSFSVELAGAGVSGTPSTAPQWGDLLLGCGCAEVLGITPNFRAEYATSTATSAAAFKTLSMYVYDDGVLHKLLGAMGNVKLSAKVGERPMLMFDFIGIDGGISNPSAPTGMVYSTWKVPPTMAKANVVDVTLGAVTYTLGTLAAGTTYPSMGLEIDFGNAVNFVQLLSSERVSITDRQMTGSVTLDLTPAQEVSFMAIVKANTLQALGLTIGLTAGNKIVLFAPKVQMINPKKVDDNGERRIGYDLRFTPNAGNDELVIASMQI